MAQGNHAATAASTATYIVTFDATWSAMTHPTNFPGSPHFSGLIGGTHNSSVSFWEVGQLATTGIENMAEQGSKTALENEVNTAIGSGTAEFVLSGGGIALSPGSVALMFDVTESFPLVTLVSMLAPSPDWFVGVTGLNLFDGGSWSASEVVQLTVHDAGTDDGVTYGSPDADSSPPQNISVKTTTPFDMDNVVGTFTFTLQSVLPVELSEFSAVVNGDEVTLRWRTESETDNAGFEIEHAPDNAASTANRKFGVVGFVAGQGSSSEPTDYRYAVSVAPGRHAFRLKQIDVDGRFEYSSVIEAVSYPVSDVVLSDVYPNPLRGSGHVTIRSARPQDVDVDLVDVLGREVRMLYRGVADASRAISVDIDATGLPAGLYFVRTAGRSLFMMQPVVVVR